MRPHAINGQFRLTVHKDFIESNGKWRLFWEDINRPCIGLHDESTVTGQPFFRTMRDAVNHGLRHYNERAERRTY